MIHYRIKELSKERGILLKDLAEKVGLSRVSLTRISRGEQNPTIDTLDRIAKALGVEVAELFAPTKPHVVCPYCGKSIALSAAKED